MADGPNEATVVEQPFVEQLKGLGWEHLPGDIDVPYLTERQSFREVLLTRRLREAVRQINLDDDGRPWLDEPRINEMVSALERLGPVKLMEANKAATRLLLGGTSVEGLPGWRGGRDQTVRFIDFDQPERNALLVVSHFRVDPSGARSFIVPDLVLFVNGIPLVVVECKSPVVTNPMEEAADQLLRYSNQRDWVGEDEGAERLFHYNLLMVATCFFEARFGTVGASPEQYLEWKDTSPVPMAEVAAGLGVERLASQQVLVAGMLRPVHLLDLLRNFALFQQGGGGTAKIVGRYHQFRAVQEAIRRLRFGQTRLQHGQRDQRGGVIWHTQGSGKSLTMVFLVRKMRTMPDLRRFKVVVVTDRIDLEEQLEPVAALGGESIHMATSAEDLKALLQEEGPGLVFAMIQKYQERADEAEVLEVSTTGPVTPETLAAEVAVEPYRTRVERLVLGTEPFPELNASPDILVLVDEAHRSHTSLLHANLLRALPNGARIGFTGTPIMRGARKATHEIFGDFIDRYTVQQSEADGATVPILYEGRRAEATVANGRTLDELFDEVFHERSPSEREAIRRKYATPHKVLEAPRLIQGKAEDMVRHYVDAVLPNGLKAQVVAVSRRAAVVYQAALSGALSQLVERLERLDPAWLRLDDQKLERRGEDVRFLVRAHSHLEAIKRLEAAAVISGEHNDDPAWREWSDPARRKARIDRFKKPLMHRETERRDGLAFLCVKSMLLTGFDAHVLQVLYLDRFMQGHELLQAISRVNRTHPGKRSGIVVDYFGIGRGLADALAEYDEADVRGALMDLRDELPKLDDRHRRVVAVFQGRGIADISDVEACVFLLRDVRVRADFLVKLRQFLETLDTILPRPEGLPYVRDARILGFIAKTAANLYRDSQLDLAGAGRKVRELIDRYLEARGVHPTVPPVAITDAEFERHVAARPSDRTRALEMEHALRHHIVRHLPEDPAHYKRLSERLEEILRTLRENWADLAQALHPLVDQARQGRHAEEFGLDARTHGPFAGVLAEATDMGVATTAEQRERLRALTVEIVDHVRQEIRMVDFWRNAHAQDVLRGWLVQALDASDLVSFERQEETADRLVELAKALHTRLVT